MLLPWARGANCGDGTVSGTFTIRQEWGDQNTFDADVVCFTIVGNEGYYSFGVVMDDNGEGANADPDQSSQAFSLQQPGQPQLFCNNASLVLPMHDLVRGNLAIRP